MPSEGHYLPPVYASFCGGGGYLEIPNFSEDILAISDTVAIVVAFIQVAVGLHYNINSGKSLFSSLIKHSVLVLKSYHKNSISWIFMVRYWFS